jgi:hypothetical protein
MEITSNIDKQLITTSTECVEDQGRRIERQPRSLADIQKQMKVLAWLHALAAEHPDKSFFRDGQCKNCSVCNEEFHFLHYTTTTEAAGYCIECYLNSFCDVVDDENVFWVIIKRTGRTLIQISNS